MTSTILAVLASPSAALAAESMSYNPEAGSETLKTVAGVVYLGLVAFYFIRLFKKRAERATSERIASSGEESAVDDDSDSDEEEVVQEEEEVTPIQCFIGFAQAGTICFLLFQLCTAVDGFFAAKDLPTQYTARNIAVLIQTVARGLCYLITFIFGANAVGLAGLGIQLIVAPDSVDQGGSRRRKQGDRLPSVKITDDLLAIRRAFQEAEELGKRTAEKKKRNNTD